MLLFMLYSRQMSLSDLSRHLLQPASGRAEVPRGNEVNECLPLRQMCHPFLHEKVSSILADLAWATCIRGEI